MIPFSGTTAVLSRQSAFRGTTELLLPSLRRRQPRKWIHYCAAVALLQVLHARTSTHDGRYLPSHKSSLQYTTKRRVHPLRHTVSHWRHADADVGVVKRRRGWVATDQVFSVVFIGTDTATAATADRKQVRKR